MSGPPLDDGALLPQESVDTVGVDSKQAAASQADMQRDERMRRTLADTYTFVRSQEINRVIESFTLDHYIDEAKRRIKGGRTVRDAAGNPVSQDTTVSTRPSLLDTLTKLENDFNSPDFQKQLKNMAQKADQGQ